MLKPEGILIFRLGSQSPPWTALEEDIAFFVTSLKLYQLYKTSFNA
jgi:hypothetical protein